MKYYSKESKQVRTALTKYIDASHALDMHPLVVKYLEAYQEVEHVIKDINDILFEDLKDKDSYAHCGR